MQSLALKLFTAIFVLALLAAPLSAARAGQAEPLTDIRGHLPDLAFNLIDQDGTPVTAKTYQGDIVLLYFGFTGCGSVCPATMAKLTRVLGQLDDNAASRTQILFATVDPVRDTASVMREYLSRYDPAHMTGLVGPEGGIEALARRYRAAYRPARADENVMNIVHSAAIYVFDTEGKARFLITPYDPPEAITAMLSSLAKEQV